MNRLVLILTVSALAALSLSACEADHGVSPRESMRDETLVVSGSRLSSAAPEPTTESVDAPRGDSGQAAPADAAPVEGALLAYRHALGLRLPGAALGGLYEAHLSACEAAGLATCQIVNANLNNAGTDRASAALRLRATPAWIAALKSGLEAELDAADGAVVRDQTSVEDLTTQIVDGQARLRARVALRDRLQALLETREADLDELIQVERELARIQGEIESRQSVIAALRQRVAMSQLWIEYQPAITPATRSNFAPIADALADMGRVFAAAVRALILFLAAALPWLIVGLPILWLLTRWLGRVLARRRETQSV